MRTDDPLAFLVVTVTVSCLALFWTLVVSASSIDASSVAGGAGGAGGSSSNGVVRLRRSSEFLVRGAAANVAAALPARGPSHLRGGSAQW